LAHLRKGQLTTTSEWARHLRKLKRLFWHAERKAVRQEIVDQLTDDDKSKVDLRASVQPHPLSANPEIDPTSHAKM